MAQKKNCQEKALNLSNTFRLVPLTDRMYASRAKLKTRSMQDFLLTSN